MRIKLLGLCVLFLLSSSLVAQERTWSDNTGKFKVDAELIKIENQRVFLKKTDGDEIQVPVARLSKEDLAFIKNWKPTGKGKPADVLKPTKKKSGWLTDVKVKGMAKREPGMDYDFNSKDPMPNISVELVITGKAAAGAISFGNLKLVAFKDGKGNELAMSDEQFGPDLTKEMDKVTSRGEGFMANHPKNGLRLKLETIDKPGKVTKISEVKGKIDVVTGGTPKKVTIENVATRNDGNVDLDSLKELGIKCEFKRTATSIELKVDGDVTNLASAQFLDSKGKVVEPDGWSAGGWKKSWQFSYDFEKIPAADLVLDFRVNPETVEIPFEAKNIKIKK